jgi:release factor glutamine methyltransferase
MSISQESAWLLKEKYQGEKSEAFFADCKRLAIGEPLAYLIGHVPFLQTSISLGSHPMIPRPETEFWTEKAIIEIKQAALPAPRVLDLCAGSGAIGVAVAKAIPTAIVDFCEIDEDHIATIENNILSNNIAKKRTNVVHASLFTKLPYRYDFILSNPPYIDEAKNTVDASVKDFEPHLALFGGKAGLEVINKIIEQSPRHLVSGGQLWLEHEPEQTEAITELGNQHFYLVETHRDQFGTERYTTMVVQ